MKDSPIVDMALPECDPNDRGKGKIAEWYKGRSVFITGATGFMGKVLLEKLLYSCSGIDKIYVLLRTKKGRTPEQRIEDMWKLPMFERLRKLEPKAIKKVIPVEGDITIDELGISPEMRKIITSNVSIVFHCAACIKFHEKLKIVVNMNVGGTERALALAKDIKQLKAFIHLSTAFCCPDIEELGEKFYSYPDDPNQILEISKWMKDEALIQATESIIAPHPNTYTYTKRLSECLVAKEFPNLPVAIMRPAIVGTAAIEPVPGWVDVINGPMGILVGAGKGVIRSMYIKKENRAQIIPVCLAIKGVIVAAWKVGTTTVKPPEIPVYNMTQDPVIKKNWGESLELGKKLICEYPFEGQVWYPDGDMRSSLLMHKICCIFLHWLPAYFIDFIMLLLLQKRFMVRLTTRIDEGLNLLQYFTTREWIFSTKNFLAFTEDMSPQDKKSFDIDFNLLDVEKYATVGLLGIRQYCMKEDLSSLPRCRRIQKVMYVIDRAVRIAFYLGILYLLYTYSSIVKSIFDGASYYARSIPLVGFLIPNETSH